MNHPSLKDAAATFIRDAIVSGQLGPGAKVDQDEIAAILGISRLPVREALIELTEKGFVTAIPRRGAFVVDLGVDDVEDHYKVVELVFALAARRAATQCDDAKLLELRRIHEQIGETDDPSVQESLNREFYSTINHTGSSQRLRAILRFLAGALPGSIYGLSPAWAPTEARYRQQMLVALEARDADAAARVASEHLNECARLTIEVLEQRGRGVVESEAIG